MPAPRSTCIKQVHLALRDLPQESLRLPSKEVYWKVAWLPIGGLDRFQRRSATSKRRCSIWTKSPWCHILSIQLARIKYSPPQRRCPQTQNSKAFTPSKRSNLQLDRIRHQTVRGRRWTSGSMSIPYSSTQIVARRQLQRAWWANPIIRRTNIRTLELQFPQVPLRSKLTLTSSSERN